MTALLLVCMALADGPTVSDAAGDIRIDGSLDEPAWQAATPVTEFQRFQPTKGGVPPGTTEVRFLQDDRNLYVGVRVRDANYKVRARISRREDINADDQVGVYLDTFRDGRTGYIFYFNGRGIQQDIRVGPGFSSFSWNTVLRTKGQATDDGYTLEVAIPWRSVKYPNPNDETQTWGVILTRKIPSEGAKYSYPVTERGHPRLFTQAAPLTGVKPPKRGSGLELIPSLTLIQQAARDDADELKWLELPTSGPDALPSWSRVVRPSLDLRLGLTPNLGLAATINPDFSQVDQDPTFINLNQRFAFFLPERRPFFLDGTEYFADQQGSLYSRSIVDPLYGLKLSGRAGPVSMGVLHSLDRNPGRTVNERGTPGFDEEDVQDTQALNEVARVRLDAFGDGYVGATIIDKRLINGDGQLSGVHTAAGMDTRVPLSDRWTVDGRMIHSLTGPSYDNAIWGQEVGLGIARASGIGWGVRANATDVTPGHRRETGFLNQSGITYLNSALDYTFEPSGMVDTVRPSLSASARIERNGEQQQFVGAGSEVLLGGIHR
ncbi:MAG: sugar-binding protein, partial [Myxococcota bacterium]